MDERESKWKIQENYSSSKEDDVVKRILANGFVIGREMVITGIFISSAPLVVPPLLLVSAVGFVFTVPLGVLCATYACTNKIMSFLLLLPTPSPLRLLEYHYTHELEQQEDQRKLKLGLGFYGYRELDVVKDNDDDYGVQVEGYVTDKEDNELVEDVNQEVETKIVFEPESGDDRVLMEDVRLGVQSGASFDVAGDDQGYEEVAGEYLEGDDDSLEEEGQREEVLVENWNDESESSAHEVNGDATLRDEGWVDITVEDDCIVIESSSDVVFRDVKGVGTTVPVTSESASDVVFGYVKDVETIKPVTGVSASIVAFGDEVEQEEDQRMDSKLGLDDGGYGCRELDVVEDKEDDCGVEVEGYVNYKEDNELVVDVDQEVETKIVFEPESGGDDFRQEGDALIANVDKDVDAMEMEDDTEENEREQMEDVKLGVELRPSFDVAAGGYDQGYEEDAGEYLEGDDDSLEEEWKEEAALVENWNDESESSTHEVNGDATIRNEGWVENTVEDDCIVIESASDVVFGDVKDVGTTVPVICGSASDVVFGDVETTVRVTSESASDVVFGDVETTIPVTSESVSDVVFGDVKDVETNKPVTSVSASILVFGDVETNKLVANVGASNVVFGDVKDLETNKPVTSERIDCKLGLEDGGDDYRQLERDDDILEEEPKGEELLVESPNDENKTNGHEVNEDVKSWNEVRVDNKVKDDHVVIESASDVVFGDDKDVEATEPVTVREIESEKLVESGSKNDEPVGKMRHVVIVQEENDENNFNSRVVDELDMVAKEVIGDVDANKDERNIESDEKVLRESMGTEKDGRNIDSDTSKDGSEDAILRTMEEHLIHTNEDAREENLLDERNANYNLEVGNEAKKNVADDSVDVLVCSPSEHHTDNGNKVKKHAGDDNVKPNTDNCNEVKENASDDNVDVLVRAPLTRDTDNAKATYKKLPSREEKSDEERIWEKIAAMRTIVGYKAQSKPTCIGELKALYVFTGVEPPASFEGDSDLDAKLKFLMAIVGVK